MWTVTTWCYGWGTRHVVGGSLSKACHADGLPFAARACQGVKWFRTPAAWLPAGRPTCPPQSAVWSAGAWRRVAKPRDADIPAPLGSGLLVQRSPTQRKSTRICLFCFMKLGKDTVSVLARHTPWPGTCLHQGSAATQYWYPSGLTIACSSHTSKFTTRCSSRSAGRS